MSIDNLLDEAALAMDVEVSLEGALPVLSEMADIEDSRLLIEGCLEQLLLADGSVVDMLGAENTYREWRASHPDQAAGTAVTGPALAMEMRASLEQLYSPSMESGMLQSLKRTYHTMALSMKTFGKDLVEIRSRLMNKRHDISDSPVLITNPVSYRFLTRKNAPVTDLVVSIKQDMRFIAACEKHYERLNQLTIDMGKRFREATQSDSDEEIRRAVDELDSQLMERSDFLDLTRFNLLGNRSVYLDKRGFPRFKTHRSERTPSATAVLSQLASKAIHGFSIGGAIKRLRGHQDSDVQTIAKQVRAGGGETSVEAFIKVVDQAVALNNRTIRFAQMAATMNDRVQRLSKDLYDAYDDVNTEKSMDENSIRVRELRALHRTAKRSVAQYMFMGKAIATLMEDHAGYIYRNITTMANDVLKSTKES